MFLKSSKLFCHGRLWQLIQEPNDGCFLMVMDGQTSGPPKPFLDFVLSTYFQQLEVSSEAFDRNQTHSLIASWQRHGRTTNEIHDELEVMFPYHGHPL
jgi:hypothetical protein